MTTKLVALLEKAIEDELTQTQGEFSFIDHDTGKQMFCAIGAAMYKAGELDPKDLQSDYEEVNVRIYERAKELFNGTNELIICPEKYNTWDNKFEPCEEEASSLTDYVVHLNDDHDLTFKQIVERVRELKVKQ